MKTWEYLPESILLGWAWIIIFFIPCYIFLRNHHIPWEENQHKSLLLWVLFLSVIGCSSPGCLGSPKLHFFCLPASWYSQTLLSFSTFQLLLSAWLLILHVSLLNQQMFEGKTVQSIWPSSNIFPSFGDPDVSCFGFLHFSSVQLLSRVRLFATPWITARQASLSITNSRNLLRLMSIESVMPSSHLTLCHPLLFLPSIPPSIRVFSNESTLRMRWPKYWSFSFSISPSIEHPGLISFRMDRLDLLAVQGTIKSLL